MAIFISLKVNFFPLAEFSYTSTRSNLLHTHYPPQTPPVRNIRSLLLLLYHQDQNFMLSNPKKKKVHTQTKNSKYLQMQLATKKILTLINGSTMLQHQNSWGSYMNPLNQFHTIQPVPFQQQQQQQQTPVYSHRWDLGIVVCTHPVPFNNQ